MNRETFLERFRVAAVGARDFARTFASESLPDSMLFRVRLNSSNDHVIRPDERVYPEDSSHERARALSRVPEEVVVSTLWRDERVPEWVNLSVIGTAGDATLIEVMACGRFTSNAALLYHGAEGHPPFHVLGPSLPSYYEKGMRFSIHEHGEVWELAELAELGAYREEVRSLSLVGGAFDDSTLEGLPELPSLTRLSLRRSRLAGTGLSALSRQRSLRVLQLELLPELPFTLTGLPKLGLLDSLEIDGLPAADWGFERLVSSAPRLSSLSLSADGELVLEGPCPPCDSRLALRARVIAGAVSLPARLDHLGLHLAGATSAGAEALFATVEAVRSLDLRDTPIDEACALRLAARFAPGYLDLVGTGLTTDAVGRIQAAHTRMRVMPYLPALAESRTGA